MTQIRTLIENNFGWMLILGGLLGFVVPSLGDFANYVIILLIAGLVYFACPSIKRDELLEVDIFQVGLFTLIRYAIFPIVLYFIAYSFIPDYAIGVLLLSLMPAAMAVASLSMISGGIASLGIAITVISSFLTPVIVPAMFSFLGYQVDVNEFALFFTLAFVVFAPFIIFFFGAGRIKAHKKWVLETGKASSIIIMALILLVVVSSYKETLLSNPAMLLEGSIVMFILFFVFYAFGFVFSKFVPQEQRPAYVYSSGAMNNGLAIGLSFIYFSPETTFFIVISEVVWCFYVAASQYYFTRRAKT